jgi:NodT family efflux transporter outer membrane factor (OMF) lipoprotein
MQYKQTLLAFISVVLFTACVTKIDKQTQIEALDIKNELDNALVQSLRSEKKLNIDWWRAYGDKQLNGIIDQALEKSPTINSIKARYAQAHSIIASVQAGNVPNISAKAGVAQGRFSENYIFPPPLGGSDYSLYQTGVALNYEFDFWNARGSKILSAKYSAMAQNVYIDEMKLALSSAICELYLSWSFDEKRVQKLSDLVTILNEEQTLLNSKYKQGLADATMLNTKKSDIAIVMQKIYAVKQSIEGKKESICILGGFLPSYADKLVAPSIQENFKVPLPKEVYLNLIAHRADVTVQKYTVLSKGQKIENAKAQFYPNISLSGLIGFTSLDFEKFFDNSSFAPESGVAFSLPLFDGGARDANLKINTSDYNSSVYDYNNVVIKAANEVIGVLKKTKFIELQIHAHEESFDAKIFNEEIALKKYRAGLTNKLPYLVTKRETLQSELTKIDLGEEKSSLQINLIKALGGGYKEEGADASN